jgi:deferrochelatase/peroxidase EfeB
MQGSFPAPNPMLKTLTKCDALGAPMELHPLEDPNWTKNKGQFEVSALKTMNNTDSFNYKPTDQTRCPYASHMRKTGPRDDYPGYTKHVMMRRGIPYGPPCLQGEQAGGSTQHERGLLFVSYQSSIENGFVTQQKRMCLSRTLKVWYFLTICRVGKYF